VSRRIVVIVLVVAAIAAVAAAGALARARFATHVVYDFSGAIDAKHEFLAGHLESDAHKCVVHRKVKILGLYEGEGKALVVDVDFSSQRGEFAGQAPDRHNHHDLTAFGARAVRKTVGDDVCKPGRLAIE
jgi:hypothetical protein